MPSLMNQLCTKCGERKAMHRYYTAAETPKDRNLCCVCHIRDGGIPADWHSDCMEEYKKMKPKMSNIKTGDVVRVKRGSLLRTVIDIENGLAFTVFAKKIRGEVIRFQRDSFPLDKLVFVR